MLYISTRNINETFTAYRALNEEFTPDGGLYVPYHMPVLTAEMLMGLKEKTTSENIADILNLFFSMRISASNVEACIGKFAFGFYEISQNVLFAELWRTSENSSDYIFKALHRMMTGKAEMPRGWAYIAIQIALLFSVYGAMDRKYKEFDVAIPADDFMDLAAVLYAKDMGLPVKKIICTCGENDTAWDVVNNGEININQASAYIEHLLYKYVGNQGITTYTDTCAGKGVYYIDEVSAEIIKAELYAAVVSAGRIDTVISSMYGANGYHIDAGTALAYGGLQDYRASAGVNERTVIFAKERPERIKE